MMEVVFKGQEILRFITTKVFTVLMYQRHRQLYQGLLGRRKVLEWFQLHHQWHQVL
ncbi:MAG: hypothetical protein GY696_20440 [Gammaproteobacteria bacterium]|nr:hypothetical protein [Gammaproteobacteria bacterium]